MNANKVDVFKVSLAASVVTLFIILSFQRYFFYIPFQNGFDVLSTFGFTAILGWVSLVVAPPLLLWKSETWTKQKNVIFLISVLLWTASTVGIKIYTLSTVGQVFAEYLVLYPVLFFMEWLLPGYYFLLARTLRKSYVQTETTKQA